MLLKGQVYVRCCTGSELPTLWCKNCLISIGIPVEECPSYQSINKSQTTYKRCGRCCLGESPLKLSYYYHQALTHDEYKLPFGSVKCRTIGRFTEDRLSAIIYTVYVSTVKAQNQIDLTKIANILLYCLHNELILLHEYTPTKLLLPQEVFGPPL